MTVAGATAVFATWAKGYSYRGEGPSELYIQMDGVTSQEQADAFCDEVLRSQKDARLTRTLQGYMTTGMNLPVVGSKMDGVQIVGYSATLQGDRVLVTPELDDPMMRRSEALRRRIERASSGTTSLWGSPNKGNSDSGTGTDTTPPAFTISGKLVELLQKDDDGNMPDRDSAPWPTKTGWKGAWLNGLLTTPGTSTTRVDAFKYLEVEGGVDLERIATLYIGAGKRRAICRIGGDGLLPGEALMMRVVSVGLNASHLTVTAHGAPV